MARTTTNFQALMKVKEYYENENFKKGYVTSEQIANISEICELKTRSMLELQDLRDFTVALFSDMASSSRLNGEMDKFDEFRDLSSAVTHIIDKQIAAQSTI